MSDPASRPLPLNPIALRLCHLSVLPFVLGALLVWLVRADVHQYVVEGLTIYAGLTISMLGGIHWGLGMRQTVPSPAPFIWGAVTVLVGWIGAIMPAYAGFVVHGAMLIACYLWDRRHYPALGAGAWLTLRFRLSAVAALCCFLGAAGT